MVAPTDNGPAGSTEQEPTMTKTFTKTIRNASIALALVTSISALSSTASFAYSAEAQAQCTGDAFRLCSDEIPNIPKITACMFKKRAQLSVGCRAVMDRDLAKKSNKVAAD
jgi:hypothetical protein